MSTHTHIDDLNLLFDTLPITLRDAVKDLPEHELLEVIMDLGRQPQARLVNGAVTLSEQAVTRQDIQHVVALLGEFGADNRSGIESTLHRISAIRNRRGEIIGLTLRVGRAITGTIDLVRDLIEAGTSTLLLGRPGVGKTTKLREVARVLADEFDKRVIIIDTSNEIGGDGDIPHPAIGGARRMQVPHPNQQHAIMVEAVENHMPEVIIVDEIGTAEEALAARTIAERGVQLIGTAHGNTLANLVQNPTLSDLIGGVQTVTLGDEEARFRHTQKTINERKGPPTFTAVVEIVDRDEVIIHRDTAQAVDQLLRVVDPGGVRRRSQIQPAPESDTPYTEITVKPVKPLTPQATAIAGTARLYPYALSRDSVERVIRDLRIDARTVSRPEQAQLVIALRSRASDPRLQRILLDSGAALHLVKKNTTAQIRHTLQDAFHLMQGMEESEVDSAVKEVEAAVLQVINEGEAIALPPRSPELRKLQHRIAMRHRLMAESEGNGDQRHLVIYPSC